MILNIYLQELFLLLINEIVFFFFRKISMLFWFSSQPLYATLSNLSSLDVINRTE